MVRCGFVVWLYCRYNTCTILKYGIESSQLSLAFSNLSSSMVGSLHESSTPPMRVVLGSLASHDDTPPSKCAEEASVAGKAATTSYIIGTSYHTNPRRIGSGLKLKLDGRVPMEDRKTPLSQFRPRSLVLSVSLPYNHCSCFVLIQAVLKC